MSKNEEILKVIGELLSDKEDKSLETRIDVLEEKVESFEGPREIVMQNPKTLEIENIGIQHYMFEYVMKAMATGANIMLVGPAGTGKTRMVEEIADLVKRDFYPISIGPQTTTSQLKGFNNVSGYQTTPAREAYEKGGVLLLDEFDAGNAGVVTALNSMLSNGRSGFPDTPKGVHRHEDFRCISACNTHGTGRNREYVGRNKLDAATLDRFCVIEIDLDESLEASLLGVKIPQKQVKFEEKYEPITAEEWVRRIHHYRKNINEHNIKVILSMRAMLQGYQLILAGFTIEQVEDMIVFKGCDKLIEEKIKKDFKPAKRVPLKKKRKSKKKGDNGVPVEVVEPEVVEPEVVEEPMPPMVTVGNGDYSFHDYIGVTPLGFDDSDLLEVFYKKYDKSVILQYKDVNWERVARFARMEF